MDMANREEIRWIANVLRTYYYGCLDIKLFAAILKVEEKYLSEILACDTTSSEKEEPGDHLCYQVFIQIAWTLTRDDIISRTMIALKKDKTLEAAGADAGAGWFTEFAPQFLYNEETTRTALASLQLALNCAFLRPINLHDYYYQLHFWQGAWNRFWVMVYSRNLVDELYPMTEVQATCKKAMRRTLENVLEPNSKKNPTSRDPISSPAPAVVWFTWANMMERIEKYDSLHRKKERAPAIIRATLQTEYLAAYSAARAKLKNTVWDANEEFAFIVTYLQRNGYDFFINQCLAYEFGFPPDKDGQDGNGDIGGSPPDKDGQDGNGAIGGSPPDKDGQDGNGAIGGSPPAEDDRDGNSTPVPDTSGWGDETSGDETSGDETSGETSGDETSGDETSGNNEPAI
uniref:Uncharacterized protein n=1 Tax=Porterella carnosula TaxID=101774 RepID=A0A1L6BVN4_9ASTR|nr:hypothetical protein Po_car1Pt0304 [Porterella carnosula]APQ40071.1 hypothetical protein Po_car1Pt0304 [Porterella carnosula]